MTNNIIQINKTFSWKQLLLQWDTDFSFYAMTGKTDIEKFYNLFKECNQYIT